MTRDLCAGRWRLTYSCCPHSQSAVLGRRNPSPGEARALRHGHGASARTRRGRPATDLHGHNGRSRSRPGCALGARARAAVLGRPPSSAHPGTGPALSTRRPATPQHSGGCRTSHHVCGSRGAGGGWLATQRRNGARSPEPGSQAPCTSAPTPVAGGRASASVRITSGARRPLTEGLSHALQGVNRSHWPLPARCQQQGPSHCDYPRQRQTRSNAPEGVGVEVGTTNRPLWRTTALRRGRQHDLRPMGVTSPMLPGPVRCELRDTPRPRGRQTRAGARGRQARLPPAPA